MVEYISGILKEVDEVSAVIDVAGFGAKIIMPVNDISELPGEDQGVKLFVRPIIKDESVALYGFVTRERRDLFNLLITVPTVGPSLAISLLSSLDNEDIVGAITSEDHERLYTVPGIGKKTSQKIVIELKDKLKKLFGEPYIYAAAGASGSGMRADALEALLALGFSRHDSVRAFSEVFQSSGKEDTSVDNIIKLCLKKLSEKGGRRN